MPSPPHPPIGQASAPGSSGEETHALADHEAVQESAQAQAAASHGAEDPMETTESPTLIEAVKPAIPEPWALRWVSSGRTDRGMVRELNEDALLLRPEAGLWVVADGMGGHRGGEVASDMVVTALAELPISQGVRGITDFLESVEDALAEVNARLRQMAGRGPRTVGCTVAVLIAHRAHAICAWAGDSRIYRWRENRLTQITQDHALVAELVDSGLLTTEQAIDHPHGNLVTRAVGAADDLFIDAEILSLRPDDRFILCTDGLDKEVDTSEIAEILALHDNASEASEALLKLALDRGSRDNVTVVAVDILSDPRAPVPNPLGPEPTERVS